MSKNTGDLGQSVDIMIHNFRQMIARTGIKNYLESIRLGYQKRVYLKNLNGVKKDGKNEDVSKSSSALIAYISKIRSCFF